MGKVKMGDFDIEDVLELLRPGVMNISRFSQADLEDMEAFYTELITKDKADGIAKKECWLKGKWAADQVITSNRLSKMQAKQANEIFLKVLNKVYSDEPPISQDKEIDTAFDCLRDMLKEDKQKGVTKEVWQKRGTNDYIEAISEGKDKEACHQALERMLKMVDEVYGE